MFASIVDFYHYRKRLGLARVIASISSNFDEKETHDQLDRLEKLINETNDID